MYTWQKLKNNPELRKQYYLKNFMLRKIREFFAVRNYPEFECPILTTTLPQERYLDVLHTTINTENKADIKAYLIPTTETFNKRLLATGFSNHFMISKVFRGLEEISPNHTPEFTMMEWYTTEKDYKFHMSLGEELIKFLAQELFSEKYINSANEIIYQDKKIKLNVAWPKMSIKDIFKKYLNCQITEITEVKQFSNKISNFFPEVAIPHNADWQTVFELFLANIVEPELPNDRPYYLYLYPSLLCPLTKESEEYPGYSEKAELYIAGKEISNGYSELTDWKVLEDNFKIEQAARTKLNKQPVKFDQQIIEALKSGIPETAGTGMGIDRLAMIFANVKSISEINIFPAEDVLE